MFFSFFILFFLVLLRGFVSTPVWDLDRFIGFPGLLLGVVCIFLVKQVSIRVWVITFFVVGLVCVITSSVYYKQTLGDGIIASIGFFMVFATVPLYILLKGGKVSKTALKYVTLFCCWLYLFLKVYLSATKAHYTYSSVFTGTVKVLDARFFPNSFLFIGNFYYFTRLMRTGKLKYLAFSGAFLILPNIFELQRVDFLFSIILMAYIFFKNFKRGGKSIALYVIGLTFCVSFLVVYFFSSLLPYFEHFGQAVDFFLNPSQVKDVSTAARYKEAAFFVNKIPEDPYFGLGMPRALNKGQLFGNEHSFNLADMGVIGILGTSGIFGLLIFVSQLIFVFRLGRVIDKENNIIYALYCFLLYLSLASIANSSIFQYPYQFVALIMIITHFSQKRVVEEAVPVKTVSDLDENSATIAAKIHPNGI